MLRKFAEILRDLDTGKIPAKIEPYDYCSCQKPAGAYGVAGFHLYRSTLQSLEFRERDQMAARGEKWPDDPQEVDAIRRRLALYVGAPMVYELCPFTEKALRAKAEEKRRKEAARTGRQLEGRSPARRWPAPPGG